MQLHTGQRLGAWYWIGLCGEKKETFKPITLRMKNQKHGGKQCIVGAVWLLVAMLRWFSLPVVGCAL